MSFVLSKKKHAPSADINNYCRIHGQRIVQLGNCLTCASSCSICQVKGCIQHHSENQRIHSVFTVQYVRHQVNQFLSNSQNKREYLKKMVSDYFSVAKQQLQTLFEKIYASIQDFEFDSILFEEDERDMISRLIQEDYNNISCTEIGIIIPKLAKAIHFEDGHFVHLRDFIKKEKENIAKIFDSTILNLPYFRNFRHKQQSEFLQISAQALSEINQELRNLNFRPKRLSIKYIEVSLTHKQDYDDEEMSIFLFYFRSNSFLIQADFIRLLCTQKLLFSLQEIQLYCIWNIDEEDFQIAFFEALSRFPYLTKVMVKTGYEVESTKWIDEILSQNTVDVRIYKQPWTF